MWKPSLLLPLLATLIAGSVVGAADVTNSLKLSLSWGYQSKSAAPFCVRLLADGVELSQPVPVDMEPPDELRDGTWHTRSGGGDVDGLELLLRYPPAQPGQIANLNSIWAALIAQSDPDTARRLRSDPAFQRDGRRLTVQMDREGTKGFSVAVSQLLEHRALWVPSLDVYLAVGDPPIDFAAHSQQLRAWQGKRILDRVRVEPEATYAQYTALWEDMGSPRYAHPSQPAPGHIVCLGWDSALYKFGVDRGAGVWSDLGNPDSFHFWFDFGVIDKTLEKTWKGQRLADALPVICTVIERDGLRYAVEQFAYPLHGPPAERRGDIPMLLLNKVQVTNPQSKPRSVAIALHHRRRLPAKAGFALVQPADGSTHAVEETADRRVLFAIQGQQLDVQLRNTADDVTADKPALRAVSVLLSFELPAGGSREFIVKLASPPVSPDELQTLFGLEYAAARDATLKFWSDYLMRGAQFQVPEQAVNELFRANLWHALRLPRRHGGPQAGVKLDLPYSNFAYGQQGIPWPINQAVYVDYMLYDLRGYHQIAAEELAAIFRSNQQANGRVGGYANWLVYTPGMMYAVAQNYLLSGDRAAFEQLLPPALKALDWCLEEIRLAQRQEGPTKGLVRGPLNDLTGDGVWAFNQAYLYAGLDTLGRALEQAGHPRAQQCRSAAENLRQAIVRGFGAATMRSPLVQLRDRTWTPYVPSEAASSGRRFDQWYPTDVDTGALHLPRLRALPACHPLTDALLHDHEDNLFLHGWGMANEPVYNPQATVYLLRDDPQAAIRAFYSMMACAFSHSVYEPVEHRWTWGQYFGPPSTDGAWFELYRKMLLDECDDDTLLLLQAVPRLWLADGKQIVVARAPTWFGPLTMTVASHAAKGYIVAEIAVPQRRPPKTLLVRFRHPDGKPMRSVTVNGEEWREFEPAQEWVIISNPKTDRYTIKVEY